MPPFEAVAPHARAAADGTFLHRAGLRAVERLERMHRLDVLAVGVVQEIERLGDDRVGEHEVAAVLQLPLDGRVADGAHAVGAGQEDRPFQETRFLDPVDAGHVAVAVQIERGRKHRIPVAARPRKDGRDTGADRALPWHQLALAFDQGDVAHRDAGDVGDRICGARLAGKRNAEIAAARSTLRHRGEGRGGDDQNGDSDSHDLCSYWAGRVAPHGPPHRTRTGH